MRKFAALAVLLLLSGGCSSVQGPEEKPVKQETVAQRPATDEMTISVEGKDETIVMNLVEGAKGAYSMYIDENRYQFVQEESKDVIVPADPLPASYPDVKLEISLLPGESPQQAVEEVKKRLEEEYDLSLDKLDISSPFDAVSLHGVGGNEPDSIVVNAYLLERQTDTLLIIERSFLEAAEGHGARFHQMLETLETE